MGIWKRLILIFIVLNIVAIGVAIMLDCGLGPDTTTLFCDGIFRHVTVSIGTVVLIYNVIIILIAFVFAKENLGFGTIFYALLIGHFIDFYQIILSPLHIENLNFSGRFLGYIVGISFYSFGLMLLIQLNLGMNALDASIVKASEKIGIPYMYIRIFMDFVFVVTGILLGATFGIGTIIAVVFTGTFISFFGGLVDWKKLLHI
ncbi:MAG: hypothetical protein LBM02_08885 [Lachnospiraceae bacterium]|jgi:uncharacterized membrane protein YczE|nr:hypothetical protein [Lachnospiraceae bacterium]